MALCDVLPVVVGLQARKCCRNRCRCKVFRLGDHPHPRHLTRAPELPSRRQLRRAPAYAILCCTPAETCMPYLRGLRLKRPSVFVFLHPSSTNANSLQSFPGQQLLISFRHIIANTGAQHPCTAVRADHRGNRLTLLYHLSRPQKALDQTMLPAFLMHRFIDNGVLQVIRIEVGDTSGCCT